MLRCFVAEDKEVAMLEHERRGYSLLPGAVLDCAWPFPE